MEIQHQTAEAEYSEQELNYQPDAFEAKEKIYSFEEKNTQAETKKIYESISSFVNGEKSADSIAKELLEKPDEKWVFDKQHCQEWKSSSNDRICGKELIYESNGQEFSRTEEIRSTNNSEFIGSHEAMIKDLIRKGFHELPPACDGKNTFLTISYVDSGGYLFYITLKRESTNTEKQERTNKIQRIQEIDNENTGEEIITYEEKLWDLLKSSLRHEMMASEETEAEEEQRISEWIELRLSFTQKRSEKNKLKELLNTKAYPGSAQQSVTYQNNSDDVTIKNDQQTITTWIS